MGRTRGAVRRGRGGEAGVGEWRWALESGGGAGMAARAGPSQGLT